MSLIERAVARLEQLKRAGLDEAPPAIEPSAGAPVEPSVPPRRRRHSIPSEGVSGAGEAVAIDLERLAALHMVTPIDPRSVIAEEYRVIKRPLLHNVRGSLEDEVAHPNLIMVTSALPGEGKSFTAINLAMSIAMELDHTVLLVDADVSKPSVLEVLGLEPRPGLMDVLANESIGLQDVMLRTSVDKLCLLPAGMPHQRATELLASESMADLLEEIASRYPDRIVIFDSPPLLVTTEARVLATHMGQVVMVVEAAHTTSGAIRQALAAIESCPVKLAILNKARDVGPGGYYGYGYGGYGYGYGYGSRSGAT